MNANQTTSVQDFLAQLNQTTAKAQPVKQKQVKSASAGKTEDFLKSIGLLAGEPAAKKLKKAPPEKKSDSIKSADEHPDQGLEQLIAKAMAAKRMMEESSKTESLLEMLNARPASSSKTATTVTPASSVDNPFVSNAALARTQMKLGPIKVAAYIRVSTDNLNQEDSYETQERYFSQLLTKNTDWISAGVYSDYGISATSLEKRTGINRLLRHCKEGKVDRVICKSISRFARNTSDFMVALNTLKDNHVTILFEKENLDTADPTSDFILTTLGAIAQEESRSISENIRWGVQKRYPKGEAQNADIYGYRFMDGEDAYEYTESGYKIRRVEIVEEEAAVVRRIFQSVADGMGFNEIARELNLEHIAAPESKYTKKNKRKRTGEPNEKGQLKDEIEQGWTGALIGRMLKQERYTGDVLLQKTYTVDFMDHHVKRNKGEVPQYLVKDHHPAIIDRELFEAVQKVLEFNSERYKGVGGRMIHYPFSQKVVCGHCGRFYSTRNRGSNPIWFCPSSKLNNGKAVCQAERVYEEQLVRMFRKAVLERFQLTVEPVVDDVKAADVLSGRYGEEENMQELQLTEKASGFVAQMQARLENIQRNDFVERDRAFLKRQILAAQTGREEIEKKIRFQRAQLEMMQTRKMILDDTSITDEELACVEGRIHELTSQQSDASAEEDKLNEQLAYLEGYWQELEEDYEWREKAIEWMALLPSGNEGVTQFLNGMTAEYVKAFALSITIHDPLHYTVHWFDDTRTDVEMFSNVDDYRESYTYYMNQKYRKEYLRRKR